MNTKSLLITIVSTLLCYACASPEPTPTPHLEATLDVYLQQTMEAQESANPTPDLDATLEVFQQQTAEAQEPADPTHTKEPEPTADPSPTETRDQDSSIVTEDADGWDLYSYPDFRFSISIPSEWTVLDLTEENYDEIFSSASESNPQFADLYSSEYIRNLVSMGIK